MKSDCIDHGQKGNRRGYAKKFQEGGSKLLHRLVYCEANNVDLKSIDGLVVRHTCDNSRCINPDHLLIGTHGDNARDTGARRRHVHTKLTEEQVLYIRKHCQPNKYGNNRPNPFSYMEMSRKFGVGDCAVRMAYLGLTFKHFPLREELIDGVTKESST